MNKLHPMVYLLMKFYIENEGETKLKILEEYHSKGLLGMMFAMIPKGCYPDAYKVIFPYLEDDIKYDTFIEVYTQCEYHFTDFTIKILDSLKKLRPESVLNDLEKYADDKGFITIYRGECTKSTPVNKALSWTLDKERALWFAKRFFILSGDAEKVGYVYTAKVKVKDVIGYYDGRNEAEIIVRYKYLEVISKDKIKQEGVAS